MRKHTDKVKIEQLNQTIDELIQGRRPEGDDDDLQLLQRLNNLYQDGKEAEVVMKRLYPKVTTTENNDRTVSNRRKIWHNSFAIPALGMILAVCITTGIYIRTMNKNEGTPTIRVATNDTKSPVSNTLPNEGESSPKSIRSKPITIIQNKTPLKTDQTATGQLAASPQAEPTQQAPIELRKAKKEAYDAELSMDKMASINEASTPAPAVSAPARTVNQPFLTESYDHIRESRFHSPIDEPLSTFSVDVDTASYANVRRFIKQGQAPPKDAVRIEEMLNYFTYGYPKPTKGRPFSVLAEMGECPWNKEHQLVRIGLQGRKIDLASAPPNNLVFLLDVSGSMEEPNKLPLVKASIRLLVQEMRPQDKVSMVVYAGAAGMVLPPTSGRDKEKILAALEGLEAGGTTAGGEGIQLAYKSARDSFIKHGNNRVILATDGDFNIGASSDGEMERLIEKEREDGISLSVLGFGMGNYKDSKMEKLADKGNSNGCGKTEIFRTR